MFFDDDTTPLQVFSATFKGQETTQGNASTSTPPTVQVESVAPTSNLEVLAVNLSALNSAGSIEAFSGDFSSPAEQEQARLAAFCRELLSENPGPLHRLTACSRTPRKPFRIDFLHSDLTAACVSWSRNVTAYACLTLTATGSGGIDKCHCRADLKICEPDKQAKLDAASATPNDPLKTQQWALNAININGAWKSVRAWCPNHLLHCSCDCAGLLHSVQLHDSGKQLLTALCKLVSADTML